MNQLFDTNLDNPQKRRLLNAVVTAVVLLAVFLGVKSINAIKEYSHIGSEIYPTSTIVVSGTGEVFSVPDTGSFSFSVNEEGKTMKDAQDKSSKKTNAIIDALKGMNIEDKDIKTTGYNSGPKYEWRRGVCPTVPVGAGTAGVNYYCNEGKNVLVGYEVSQTISVKVRKTEDAGNVLTKVGELGATNISNLDFVVDDMDAVKIEARDLAITNAKEKAKTLSKSLGIKLVKIINFSDSGDYPPIYYGAMDSMSVKGMGGETATPVPQVPVGENRIVSNVSITYEVK